ncbi:MAG: hypothetical protein U0469_03210 [Candidatus Paceibacterota bacterium]|jgi:hypothetical protein
MTNHQHLFRYIKNKTSSGSSKEEIKSILMEVGWKDEILEEAFIIVEEKERKRKNKFKKAGFLIFIFLISAILFFSFLFYQKNEMNERLYRQKEIKIETVENINPNLSQQEYVEKMYGKERVYSATTSSTSVIRN